MLKLMVLEDRDALDERNWSATVGTWLGPRGGRSRSSVRSPTTSEDRARRVPSVRAAHRTRRRGGADHGRLDARDDRVSG